MSVMNDSDKLALAREMFQAWDVMDWTRVVDLFAEDGVLHSVMQEPLVGKEAVAGRIALLASKCERITLKIESLGVIDGRYLCSEWTTSTSTVPMASFLLSESSAWQTDGSPSGSSTTTVRHCWREWVLSPTSSRGLPTIDISLGGLWQDRPPREVTTTARLADKLGFGRVWVGGDGDVRRLCAGDVGRVGFEYSELVVGPLAVTVRDPAMIAIGAASVADLTGRTCRSPWVRPALSWSKNGMDEAGPGQLGARGVARGVRALMDGERGEVAGTVMRTSGYRLRLQPPGGRLIVAAFGGQGASGRGGVGRRTGAQSGQPGASGAPDHTVQGNRCRVGNRHAFRVGVGTGCRRREWTVTGVDRSTSTRARTVSGCSGVLGHVRPRGLR